jgi:hypothetical protein
VASTGNVFPGTGSSVARSSATAWTDPSNIVSDNGSDATCSSGSSGSAYLVASGFDFSSIPDDATILGITVRVEASEHSGGTEWLTVQLQGSSGALVGTGSIAVLNGTTKAVYTLGGASSLWGATLTAADVKDSDFGVRSWFVTAHDVRIDYVTVAVEYSTEINEALTGSAVTMAVGTLIPTPEFTPIGLEIAAATGAVGAPESHGQVITSALQTLSELVISVALAGAQIISGAGTLGTQSQTGDDAALTGVESVSAVGTAVPDYTRALTGEAVTVSAGSATVNVSPTPVAGQSVVTATGIVVEEGPGGLDVHISGVETTFELGAVTGGTLPTGQAVTPAAGTAAPEMSMPLVGSAVTFSQGSVGAGQDADDTYIASSAGLPTLTVEVALEGDQVDCSAGSVLSENVEQPISGSAGTLASGTVALVIELPLIGSGVTASQYNVGAPGFAALVGSSITATSGTVYLDGDRSLGLTGESVSVLDGVAVTSYLAFATGEQLTVSAQEFGPRVVALTGALIESATGNVRAPDERSGRSKAKGRDKKIVVTIDEQQFIVESEEEAVALLEQAAEVAAETAALQVAKVAESSKRGRKKALASAREALQTPVIAVEDFDAQSYIAKITQTYAEALKEIETKKKAEDKRTQDEEDAIILNLLNL